MMKSSDPIVQNLANATDDRAFELLCTDVLAGTVYPSIEPIGGTSDGGRDALYVDNASGTVTVCAFSLRQDWKTKLGLDCRRVQELRHKCDCFLIATSTQPTPDERDKAVDHVREQFNWQLELYGRERLATAIRGKLEHLIERHPAIFQKACFRLAGGRLPSEVVNCYLEEILKLNKVDETPGVVICVVPDQVFKNCRMKSTIPVKERVTREGLPAAALKRIAEELADDQLLLFPETDEAILEAIKDFAFSPDFRRHLKAKVMPIGVPVQIIRESTLNVTPGIEAGEPGTNPLSDRLWNLSVGLAYKTGQKPWKLAAAREGVCYVGIAFKKTERGDRDACCAAQMFLDSGDGIVFVGEFGPWYSPENKQFELLTEAAQNLLEGTLRTYSEQGGPPLQEVFLHCASRITEREYEGYKRAVPDSVKLVICRIRDEKNGPRLFRPGDYPPIRGTFLKRHDRYGLLYSSGFNPAAGTYEGFEVPVPLGISIQHGEADLLQVARDILIVDEAEL